MLFLALRSLRAHPLRSLLTALAIALGVAMMLSASVIGQAASQSAERLSQANATDAVVQSGPAFNTLTFQALLVLVGVIILFTAGFVIANAFGMAVTARLKELGALRTLGMTRRQVLNLVLIEAGGVGLAGAIGGLLLGVALAGVALQLAGMGGNLSVPVWALIASPLIGFTVTVGAALFPALQASRVSPLEALRPASRFTPHASRSFVLPSSFIPLLLVGLGLYAFIGKPDVFTALAVLLPAMVVLLALVAMLMPALVGPVANFARPWLIRWVGHTAGRLAADHLQRHPTRAALTAGAMTAGLTMMIAVSGLMTVVLKGGLLTFGTIAREDRVILFDLSDPASFRAENSLQMFIEAPPLPPELLARLQILANAGQVELDRLDMVTIPAELSPTPSSPGVFMAPEVFVRRGSFDFSEGNAEDALRYFAQGPAVLLMPITAQRLNVQVGDTVSVQTLTGPVAFTVAGIGANVWVMTAFSFTDGQKYFGVTEPTFMGISVREGQNKEVVLKQVDDIVADYGLVAFDMKSLLREFFRIGDQIIGLMNALLLLTVLVAALGVVNTMVINVTERQREIGMLRAIGATQKQVRQMVVAEGVTLGLFAVVAAVLVSFIIVLAYFLLVSPNGLQSLGFRLNWEIVRTGFLPALPVMAQATLTALIFAPLIAGLAAYYPAQQAAALDVIDATRDVGVGLVPTSTQRGEGEPEDRALPRSLVWLLAGRALSQNRTRTILSVIAIALGTTMTVAGDGLAQSIIGVVTRTEDLRAIGEGLWSQLDPAFKGIGVGITLAAGFLIFNTFAMSLTQRRQQIGALRALGMTRGQVLRMALTEALFIGGLGTALGLLIGPFFGQAIIALMRTLPNNPVNAFVPSQPSLLSFVLATGLGLGVTVLAALQPAQQATKLSPLVALKTPDLPGVERSPLARCLGLLGVAMCSLLMIYLALSPPALWLQPPYDQFATLLAASLWILGIALALPLLVDVVAISLRALSQALRLPSAVFRLLTDNFQRGRGRVLLTVVTLAISLTMIGALTGFIQFFFSEFFGPKLNAFRQEGAWAISMMDIESGLAGYADMESLRFPPEALAAMRATTGDRGNFMTFGFVIVPELSFMGDAYFSFVINPQALREAGSLFITFKQGDWDTALPIMERGCGVLITPAIAARNNVAEVGETFTVTSRYGPVTCTVAGIGTTFVGASIISDVAQDQFDQGDPFTLFIKTRPGVDGAQLEADLLKTADQYGVHVMNMKLYTELMLTVFDNTPTFFNAFLLLAVLAAALGVVNTTLISVTERRREFGQLRALGATRAQVRAVVVGEAALMGLLGGLVGLVASVGLTIIFATVLGGSTVGLENYQPWAAAFRTLPKVWPTGLIGVLASPLICALAAYFPARSILRGAAVETLMPEQSQPITRQQIVRVFNRGSIQTRFVLGTAVLLLVVLAGLIQVVTMHARTNLLRQMSDATRAIVGWYATAIESALPAEAQTIDLAQLQAGAGQSFDADALLRFRALIDDMSDNGLKELVVADRSNAVIFGLDQRDIGETVEALDDPQQTAVREIRVEGDSAPHLLASAPLHNQAGDRVGSLRMTLRFTAIQNLIDRIRNILWAMGLIILAIGLLASYALSAPFTRAARTLVSQAARVTQGNYSPILNSQWRIPISVRTRLTLLMTLLVIVLVGGMGLVVVPIERTQMERLTQEGMLTSIQWLGEAMSESLSQSTTNLDLLQMLRQVQSLDVARLQELSEELRGDNIAYMTIADAQGKILFSDKLSLMGETGPTATTPHLTDGEWNEEPIWIASTPLRQGSEGPLVGTLSIGVRRVNIENFLAESRNLFWLTGLIAVLAGVLLAQALGGAVAAPAEALATGARRVAQGDLSVRFGGGAAPTADELSQLAYAFNQMVVGLREREKLRDLFGRYVSREVSEAVLSGRVSLKGERRTITCLYVDMRGSTTFAEKYQPEEVMAALNEYFEVIILATETQGGIVNRFVGDEAVCVFGAPTEYPDHADRALQAALAIRAGLAYLNQKRASLDLPILQFGMGLNSGVVTAGATGSEERQEYTVIGDAMNVGARIQALTKTFPEHDILLSEFTRAALREAAAYACVDLGEAELRGKSQPVRIWGLVK